MMTQYLVGEDLVWQMFPFYPGHVTGRGGGGGEAGNGR
jgi:hypothetical protein